jgi:hypothetical protein
MVLPFPEILSDIPYRAGEFSVNEIKKAAPIRIGDL